MMVMMVMMMIMMTIDDHWNSYRSLRALENTKIYLRRVDWIVVLPKLIVTSC